MGAIYKREMRAYFTSPLAYVVLAIMLFWSGIYIRAMVAQGYADMTPQFSLFFSMSLFAVPLLTMRLLSEERNQRTDQALLTAPVRLTNIVLGKFFATFTVLAIAMVQIVLFQLITSAFITPNWTLFVNNMLGLLLFVASLIAIGMFFSGLTESQFVSAVMSLFVSLFIMMLDSLPSYLGNAAWITTVDNYLSFNKRYQDFVVGTFNYSNVVFFLSIAALFIFLTVRVLDKKRWA